jgi:hypothetical protein
VLAGALQIVVGFAERQLILDVVVEPRGALRSRDLRRALLAR